MKKLLLGATIALSLLAGSCNKGAGEQGGNQTLNDSLSIAFGKYVGSSVGVQASSLSAEEKQEFVNAFQRVMSQELSENELNAMFTAMQVLRTLNQANSENIEMDRVVVLNAFKNVFLDDSLDHTRALEYSRAFNNLSMRAEAVAQEAREEELMNSPEAQTNGRTAEAFINNLKSEDSTIQTSESGLVYKIIEAGDAEIKPGENSTVKVKYVGKHIDGTIFDQSGDEPASFNVRGVVAGFGEGVKLLGKGGKATLYIPGKLAYGGSGQPQAGIGANEMLIFEIELVDVQ